MLIYVRTSPPGRVTLLTGKTVIRVLIENKRAVGVELNDDGLETIVGRRGRAVGRGRP